MRPIWLRVAGYVRARSFGAAGMQAKLVGGVGYAVLIALSSVLHTTGQRVSVRLVGQPMNATLLTAPLPVQRYADAPHPRRVHGLRALGGPVFSLATAAVTFSLWGPCVPPLAGGRISPLYGRGRAAGSDDGRWRAGA